MTKYSVSTYANQEWNSIALFADTVDFDAICAFCIEEYARTRIDDIPVMDLSTGEILWNYEDAQEYEDDDADESFYDPYLGCDSYEVDYFD